MKLYDNDGYREEFMALVYGLLMSDKTNDRANQIIDAFDYAPAVEAEPLPPNDPLTLEQLREMDGEPVWIEKAIGGGRWYLVEEDPDGGPYVYFRSNKGYGTICVAEFATGSRAYCRRPEEVIT